MKQSSFLRNLNLGLGLGLTLVIVEYFGCLYICVKLFEGSNVFLCKISKESSEKGII